MAKLSIGCKKIMVEEISSQFKALDSFIITNYKGLTTQDLNELRKELRNISSEYLVVKDSLMKRVFSEGPNNMLVQLINGEIGVAINRKKDLTLISKVLIRFSKGHEFLKIRGGMLNGALVSREDIKTLASLPSKEILVSRLANVLNAPMQGLVSALNAILARLAYALNAVKDKKSL